MNDLPHRDFGSMATIGRKRAVAQLGAFKVSGLPGMAPMEPHARLLSERLDSLAESVRTLSPPFADAVDRLVTRLQQSGAGATAPQLGHLPLPRIGEVGLGKAEYNYLCVAHAALPPGHTALIERAGDRISLGRLARDRVR
jgi:hypothetical protein